MARKIFMIFALDSETFNLSIHAIKKFLIFGALGPFLRGTSYMYITRLIADRKKETYEIIDVISHLILILLNNLTHKITLMCFEKIHTIFLVE